MYMFKVEAQTQKELKYIQSNLCNVAV